VRKGRTTKKARERKGGGKRERERKDKGRCERNKTCERKCEDENVRREDKKV